MILIKEKVINTEELSKFYYFFPQTVAIIGAGTNIMPAAWHTPISAQPPLYGILISPKRYTYTLLIKERGFTINFLEFDKASLIAKLGSTSGRDINKLREFKIAYSVGKRVPGVIMSDAYAAYECEKFSSAEYGDHFLFVGRVILIHYRKDVLTNGRLVTVEKVSPTLYFGKDRYLTINPESLQICERK